MRGGICVEAPGDAEGVAVALARARRPRAARADVRGRALRRAEEPPRDAPRPGARRLPRPAVAQRDDARRRRLPACLCARDPDGPVVRIARARVPRSALAKARRSRSRSRAWPKGVARAPRGADARRGASGNVWCSSRLLNVARREAPARARAPAALRLRRRPPVPRHAPRARRRSGTRRAPLPRDRSRPPTPSCAGNAHLARPRRRPRARRPIVLPTVVPCDDGPPDARAVPAAARARLDRQPRDAALPARRSTIPLAAVVALGRRRSACASSPTASPSCRRASPSRACRGRVEGEDARARRHPGRHRAAPRRRLDAGEVRAEGPPDARARPPRRRERRRRAGEQVRHGVTGFLAATPEDWVTRSTTLLRDPALRRAWARPRRRTCARAGRSRRGQDRVVSHRARDARVSAVRGAIAPPAHLVVRLPNPAGDVVLATPALRALRTRAPATRITWAGRAAGARRSSTGSSSATTSSRSTGRSLDGGLGAPLALGRRVAGHRRRRGPPAAGTRSRARSRRALGRAACASATRGAGGGLLLTHAIAPPRRGGAPRPEPMREHYLALAAVFGGGRRRRAPAARRDARGRAPRRARVSRARGAAGPFARR